MITTYRMRATFTSYIPSPEEDTEPTMTHGWVSPWNPWGSFRQDSDDNSAEPAEIEFDDLDEAAEFVNNFPGGVWDFTESNYDTVDYRTGETMEVTLHVDVLTVAPSPALPLPDGPWTIVVNDPRNIVFDRAQELA